MNVGPFEAESWEGVAFGSRMAVWLDPSVRVELMVPP